MRQYIYIVANFDYSELKLENWLYYPLYNYLPVPIRWQRGTNSKRYTIFPAALGTNKLIILKRLEIWRIRFWIYLPHGSHLTSIQSKFRCTAWTLFFRLDQEWAFRQTGSIVWWGMDQNNRKMFVNPVCAYVIGCIVCVDHFYPMSVKMASFIGQNVEKICINALFASFACIYELMMMSRFIRTKKLNHLCFYCYLEQNDTLFSLR